MKGRFVHFSTDNVDINEYTLDGKGTFHATQVAAWQRGPPEGNLLAGIDISKKETFQIPEAMTDVIPAPNRGITERPFSGVIAADCFTQSPEQCPSAQNAHATDMAFILSRSSQKPMPSWTLFNQKREHSQSGENYSRILTYHTVSCIWTRYAEHSHQASAPCSQVDGTAACCSNGGRGTLSEAVGA